MAILTDDQLLERIDAFIAKHDLSEAAFGLGALKDGGLVKDLREKGRSLSLRSANKVIAYMRDYRAPKRKPTTEQRVAS